MNNSVCSTNVSKVFGGSVKLFECLIIFQIETKTEEKMEHEIANVYLSNNYYQKS